MNTYWGGFWGIVDRAIHLRRRPNTIHLRWTLQGGGGEREGEEEGRAGRAERGEGEEGGGRVGSGREERS